ncbi:MAG TPA: transglutaminase domain-containing protein [Solirubrobacterales bacterium]|nr:transglutaminase domain-containing protein [Solirubrobacterales bacterium]
MRNVPVFTEAPSWNPDPQRLLRGPRSTVLRRCPSCKTRCASGMRIFDAGSRRLASHLYAHSWVEAYFPGIGWVTFDPTPGTAPACAQSPGP